jgi:hypothetical protein
MSAASQQRYEIARNSAPAPLPSCTTTRCDRISGRILDEDRAKDGKVTEPALAEIDVSANERVTDSASCDTPLLSWRGSGTKDSMAAELQVVELLIQR